MNPCAECGRLDEEGLFFLGAWLCSTHVAIAEGRGAKADTGAEKIRYDLIPHDVLAAFARVLSYGARKYKAWNWLNVEQWKDRYYAALLRHVEAYRAGERVDPETGEHHLAHALCCVAFMLGCDLRDAGAIPWPPKWMRR